MSERQCAPVRGRGAKIAEVLKKGRESKPGASGDGPSTLPAEPPKPRGRAARLQQLETIAPKVGEEAPSTSHTQLEPELTEQVAQLQVAETEPEPLEYRGTSGKTVPACANYIALQVEPGRGVYEYEVRFEPDVDARSVRFKLLHAAVGTRCPAKTFDGHALYVPSKLFGTRETFTCLHPFQADQPVTLSVAFRRQARLADCVHLYNVLFKRIMHVLGCTRVGRQFFDHRHPFLVPQHRLEIWPGYVTAVNEYAGGVMLCLDVSHRVLRTQSALEVIADIVAHNRQRYKQLVEKTFIGSAVLTRYNNRSYVVHDVMWDANPASTFRTSAGTELSFVEYYQREYGVAIREPEQPMLVHRQSLCVPGSDTKQDRIILLVPELCFMTGLTDAMRADFRVMKDVAQFTRVTPNQRLNGLRKFIESVRTSAEASAVLGAWGLSLARATIDLHMRVLDPETILFGEGVTQHGSARADWTSAAASNRVITAVDLRRWTLFHTAQDRRAVEDFVACLMRHAARMGIEVQRPLVHCLPDDRNETYVNALKEKLTADTQIVVFVCPTSRDDRYATIKKICCVRQPVPSQVINSRTIRCDPKRLAAITQKIALQMNCKLGGTLWSVRFPFKGWMVCGVDVYHSRTGGQQPAVCGFVASLNEAMTRWFSTCQFHANDKELADHLRPLFLRALQEFYAANGSFPAQVVVYRDGVGDGQMQACWSVEVRQLLQAIQDAGQPIRLTYIVVQKRINTRIFLRTEENPPPGSVVDSVVTKRHFYDFLLVAQQVRQGTVTPTHYIVLHDDAHIKPDHVQRLSYKMCHMYYNWTGTVRVPAPCQYAHKLAYLVGQNIRQAPAKKLCNTLFYL